MTGILSFSYWTNFYPGELSPLGQKILASFVLASIFTAIFLAIIKKHIKKGYWRPIWQHFYSLSITNSIVGVFIWFFMYEAVPFFSARFWFLLWALVNFIWFYFIVRALIRIPAKKQEYERLQEFKKYLP